MMPGKGKEQDHFVALDTQPKYRLDNGDSDDPPASSQSRFAEQRFIGLFPQIPVGKVYDYAINPNKQGVVIDVLMSGVLPIW